MDVSELFERGAKWAATKVKAITADHLDSDTPCDEWNVKAVTNHMTGEVKMIGSAARGEEPDPASVGADHVGDDPGAVYASVVDATLADLRGASLDSTWKLPFGEMPAQRALAIFFVDQMVHAWDVAKATGQEATMPAELAAAALEVVDGNIPDGGRKERGAFFGPRVPVPDDASDQDKLIGYLGRTP